MNWDEASMQADDESFAESMHNNISPKSIAKMLIEEASMFTGYTGQQLREDRRTRCMAVRVSIFREMRRMGFTMLEISTAFNTDPSNIHYHLNKAKKHGK
jgi:hypothetical protein